jgi:general secretion pathway protein L
MKPVIARLINDQQAEWISTESNGAQKLHRTAISELPTDCAIILIVKGDTVLCQQVQTPARNAKQLQQAVPYQLEDELAGDIDTLHFAYSRLSSGMVDVLIIEKSMMEGWLASVPAPENVIGIVPDFLAIAASEKNWGLLIEKDSIIARNNQGCGFNAEHELGLEILRQWYEKDQVEGITVWKTKDAPELTLPFPLQSEAQIIQHPMQLFQHDMSTSSFINLRQGEFAAREKSGGGFRSAAWLRVAALFLVFVLISFGLKLGEYFLLQQKIAKTNQAIEETFRQVFPDVKRIINPRVQMEQRIKALRSGGSDDPDFLKLLAAFSNAYQHQDKIQPSDIQYRNHFLTIAVHAPSLQTLEALKQRISNQQGASAEISSANNTSTGVDAQLKIQEAL